ncbi:MAG: hypothetical protein AW07_01013 [Candidatus Accumulibacter sp. SK-11]|nr:MAG: hypothetical protein AW07_01013 [Candidatus Accumulibacter sp. SK-11]
MSCRVAMYCRVESKGISSRRGNIFCRVRSSSPALRATTSSAPSVGSPTTSQWRLLLLRPASLQSAPASRHSRRAPATSPPSPILPFGE